MKRLLKVMIVIAVAQLAALGVAMAVSFQEWTFSTDSNPSIPEVYTNPYGQPSATIAVDQDWGTGWSDSMPDIYGSATGFWDIGPGPVGSIVLSVPEALPGSGNQLDLSVTYWQDLSQAPVVSFAGTAALVSSITTLVEDGPMGGGWYRDSSTWLVGAGNSIGITLQGDAMGSIIDSVAVTVIPEPAAGMLLAGVLLFLARWNRKRI